MRVANRLLLFTDLKSFMFSFIISTGEPRAAFVRVDDEAKLPINILKHRDVERLRFAVPASHVVDSFHCFGVTAFGQQVAWRLGHLEYE